MEYNANPWVNRGLLSVWNRCHSDFPNVFIPSVTRLFFPESWKGTSFKYWGYTFLFCCKEQHLVWNMSGIRTDLFSPTLPWWLLSGHSSPYLDLNQRFRDETCIMVHYSYLVISQIFLYVSLSLSPLPFSFFIFLGQLIDFKDMGTFILLVGVETDIVFLADCLIV